MREDLCYTDSLLLWNHWAFAHNSIFCPSIVRLRRIPPDSARLCELRRAGRTQDLRPQTSRYALVFGSNSTVGMQGFDSVILVLFAAIRDRIGSRHPLNAPNTCQ